MKINLLLQNTKKILNGYLNIDPFADGKDERKSGDISNLDELVCDGEADEILAYDILDYFGPQFLDKTLTNWMKKVKIGGKVVISTLDLDEVCRAYLQGILTHEQLNHLVYGRQKYDWELRKCTIPSYLISGWMDARGYKVLQKRFEDFKFIITAERV